MYFVPEAVPAEIPIQIPRLFAITDWKPWKRRFRWLQEQVRANPTMPYFVTERFGLELALEQIRQHYKHSGRYPWPPETTEQQRFYSFLAMISRCHHRLSPKGKTRLKGMLNDALKSDYGLAPLAFEMKIVAHLMTQGFDVVFNDMETGGGFDFFVENDEVEMEIECKFVSGDIGRQIHLKKFHQLGTILLPEMAKFLDQEYGGHLIRILIPGRLSGNNKQHRKICRLMLQAISDQNSGVQLNGYEVSIANFSLTHSPFSQLLPDNITIDQIQRFLSDKFDFENKNVLIQFSPKKGAVLVVVESAKKDAVLRGIHRQLKEAARDQFSGDRPGIMCCELADLTEDQLRELGNDQKEGANGDNQKEGTGLQYMVSDLIGRRPQIHTVVFTAPGTVKIQKSKLETTLLTSIQETGLAYIIRNSDHPLADDSRYKIF